MTYQELILNAREHLGEHCKGCFVCNGRACRDTMPGPGAKGSGDGAIRNFDKWQEIRVNIDTISSVKKADTSVKLFGKTFRLPVFAGPVGAIKLHYSDWYDDDTYNDTLLAGCIKSGIAAFTGDGTDYGVMQKATDAIAKNGGIGIPTVKPWNMELVREKIDLVKKSNAFAVAMDIDGAGLPFIKGLNPPAGSKSVEELAEISDIAGVPFIIKGVMTVSGALKALEAGASGIVVSNHGGRVQDQCPATAEVLEEICDAVDGRMTVLVDGGIRTGTDIFKALALGADGVIIARPFVSAVFGGGEEGIEVLTEKLKGELEDTMLMCGAADIKSIKRSMVRA